MRYYVLDYETDRILHTLYERPPKKWLEEEAKRLATNDSSGFCSLYVIQGKKLLELDTDYPPCLEKAT